MLNLESKRWDDLTAAGGQGGRFVAQLIAALTDNPTDEDWGEVWEQVAHQWTLESAAYAALPHLLRLGIAQGITDNPEFLAAERAICAASQSALSNSDRKSSGH